MQRIPAFESLFREALSAMDAGDVNRLKQLLDAHPKLATKRLHSPGDWLRQQIGNALDSFFKDPYLLWFVSEDAVRNKTLPSNIAVIADIIIQKAKAQDANSLQEQLNYGLRLVAWSAVARECGVQIALLDVMIDAGAFTDRVSNDALVNGNFEAAEHLIKRGAKLTLPTALCLGMWDEADQLISMADYDEKQFSLVLAALNGKTEAVTRLIRHGANINDPSKYLYSHGTPLHHAVGSGSLDTVKLLIDAGANFNAVDTAWNGTPLGWAEYGNMEDIAAYLRSLKQN